MKTVAQCVYVKEIGVTVRTTRQTRTGGILLEVRSPERADTLTEKVHHAVAGKARVTHLVRRTAILFLGVPTWVNEADVRGGLTFGVTPSDISKMSLKRGAMVVITGPRWSRSLTTRPSSWRRRGP